ncbi:hypothetical protein Dimus_007128 [Dionaea muscipula]
MKTTMPPSVNDNGRSQGSGRFWTSRRLSSRGIWWCSCVSGANLVVFVGVDLARHGGARPAHVVVVASVCRCLFIDDGGLQLAVAVADLRSKEVAALATFSLFNPDYISALTTLSPCLSNSLLLWRGVGGWTDVVECSRRRWNTARRGVGGWIDVVECSRRRWNTATRCSSRSRLIVSVQFIFGCDFALLLPSNLLLNLM